MHLKQAAINKFFVDNILPDFANEITKHQLKYLKTDNKFLKKKGDFVLEITVNPSQNAVQYFASEDSFYFIGYFSARIINQEFNKWFFDHFENRSSIHMKLGGYKFRQEIRLEDFPDDSFYEPGPAIAFKKRISMSGFQPDLDAVRPNAILRFLPDIVNMFEKNSNYEDFVFSTSEFVRHEQVAYLIFSGQKDKAKELMDTLYKSIIHNIETNEENRKSSINWLDYIIKGFRKITDFEYQNPYANTIKIRKGNKSTINLGENLSYVEFLSLDCTDVVPCEVHLSKNHIFIVGKKIVYKLNHDGKLIYEKEIVPKKGTLGFDNAPHDLLSQNAIFYNNFIFFDDNEIIFELLIPKQGKGSYVQDIAYCSIREEYYMIYENELITYNNSGEIIKNIKLGLKGNGKIFIKKRLIVFQVKEKTNYIIDFDGNILHNYDFLSGNRKYLFSNNYDMIVSYGYSTKCQVYNLTLKSITHIWAHPTHLSGYKENLYNDTHHNFDVSIVKFSSDDKYLVGGASYGVNVVWDTKSFKRRELFPSEEIIKKLIPRKKTIIENGVQISVDKKPEFVIIKNEKFLKNVGIGIADILFLKDFFIFSGANKFLLKWDLEFNLMDYTEFDGKLVFPNEEIFILNNDKIKTFYKKI